MNFFTRQYNKIQAWRWYEAQRILTQAGEQRLVLVCPYGVGDTYYVGALARVIKQRWGVTKLAVMVRPYQQGIARLFPAVERVYPLDAVDPAIFQYVPALYGEPFIHPGLRIAHVNYYPFGDIGVALGYKDIHFLDLYKMFFHLPANCSLDRPVISKTLQSKTMKRAKQLGIQTGKTVILAPETTTTVQSGSISFWQHLAEKAEQLGFHTVSLVTQASTIALGLPNPINFPLEESIALCEIAGGVVSARSGFVDLIHTAKCCLSVVYPESPWGQGNVFDVSSLQTMGLRSQVQEVIANENQEKRLIENVLLYQQRRVL